MRETISDIPGWFKHVIVVVRRHGTRRSREVDVGMPRCSYLLSSLPFFFLVTTHNIEMEDNANNTLTLRRRN